MVTMKRSAAMMPLAVFDEKGTVKFCNSPFAHLIGYHIKDVAGMNISKFMEQPYGFLHQKWLKVSACQS